MRNYDFSVLNDKDFEILTMDLLSCHFGFHIERFKAGRDAGVDGRYFSSDGKENVIQCKHWIKSGFDALLRSLKSTELDKIFKLKPKRYILVTSLDLSRLNKKEIKNALDPYVLSDSDVIGREDLNDMLSRYNNVEINHYKLWISSTTVLQALLNSAIVGRSKFKLNEIKEDSKRYVVTSSHKEAIEKLEKIHSVIITGSPGVGKTSLADQICQFYAAKEFEFFYVENSLNEAEAIYDESKKQIFYFDDFLGRNYLLALSAHQDSHIVNFIKRIERDDKKRFVLTSRSNILNQGKGLSDYFDIKNINKNEYEINICNFSDMDKARILYNHIWFGSLSESHIDELYKNKRYKDIIRHKNFNPRLITFITDPDRLAGIDSKKYWHYIEEMISNPKDIWRIVFDKQVDKICVDITICLCLHGSSLSDSDLKILHSNLCLAISYSDRRTYEECSRLLVGALLNRGIHSEKSIYYDLFNPSIADFVINNYLYDAGHVFKLLKCLRTIDSIRNFFDLKTSGIITKFFYKSVLNFLIDDLFSCEKIDLYGINVLFADEIEFFLNPINKSKIIVFVGFLFSADKDLYGEKYFKLITLMLKNKIIDNRDSCFVEVLNYLIFDYEKIKEEDFSCIFNILEFHENHDFFLELKRQFVRFISEEITFDVIREGVLSHLNSVEEFLDADLEDYLKEKFVSKGLDFDYDDMDNIVSSLDIHDVVRSNIETAVAEGKQYSSSQESHVNDLDSDTAIDDLFERD